MNVKLVFDQFDVRTVRLIGIDQGVLIIFYQLDKFTRRSNPAEISLVIRLAGIFPVIRYNETFAGVYSFIAGKTTGKYGFVFPGKYLVIDNEVC